MVVAQEGKCTMKTELERIVAPVEEFIRRGKQRGAPTITEESRIGEMLPALRRKFVGTLVSDKHADEAAEEFFIFSKWNLHKTVYNVDESFYRVLNDTEDMEIRNFDKHLYIGAPKNKKDRDEIIKLYASNKKFDETFDIDKISKLMFGLSGADIEQIMNESVMVSLQRGGKGIVSLDDVDKATMKHRASGVEIKHSSPEDIHITAIHEAGHAVMNQLLGRKVSKVSITPYSSGVGGMTIRDTDDIENKKLQTKTDIINDIKVLLAGRASEQIIFGDTSIGCSNDIERATSLAYDMLYKYAMSDTRILNPKVLKDEGVVALDNKEVIAEIDKLLQEYNKSVIDELKRHTDDIKALADRLEIEEDVYNYELNRPAEK